MQKSKLFESEEFNDYPIWSGEFNGTQIEMYRRDETGSEEVYGSVFGGDIIRAAINLATFLEDQPIDGVPFSAHLDEADPTTVVITVEGHEYTNYSVESCEDVPNEQFVVAELQLEDDEIAFLQQNGRLQSYTDEELDMTDGDNLEDDFWGQGE